MKFAVQRGFTLIELMVIVATIAVLIALAVPAYQDYSIRAKIGECIDNAAAPKASISTYRETFGTWPSSSQEAGFSLVTGDTEYCNGFTYSGGGTLTINLDFGAIDARISGNLEAVLRPNLTNAGASVNWKCTKGNTGETNIRYLPPACRGSV